MYEVGQAITQLMYIVIMSLADHLSIREEAID